MNTEFEQLPKGKKAYFASDFHLELSRDNSGKNREEVVVRWLDAISHDAACIFLVGDVFDFWFEYKNVVPKGFIRFFGKLASLRDMGIPIIIYTGNHDLWLDDYLPTELGVTVYTEPKEFLIGGKSFLIGHGDGLGPGDHFYKFLKRIFLNPICRWAFSWLHPDIGIAVAKLWSGHSRSQSFENDQVFNEDEEALLSYCKEMQAKTHFDHYIFGHRHLPLDIPLNNGSRYINLGEWMSQRFFGEFDGIEFKLKKFDTDKNSINT